MAYSVLGGTRLLALASIVVAFVAVSSRSAFAQAVSVTPAAGNGGITATVTSSGFDAGHVGYNTGFYYTSDGVHLGVLGACPGPAGTDAWANCSIAVTMPSPAGDYMVVAANSNREFASTPFTVLNSSFTMSPTCGPDMTPAVTVYGQRWAVGHVGIYVDGSLVADVLTESGDFTQVITGPSSPDGPHTIQVANSVRQNVSRTFTTPICADIGVATEVQGMVTVTHADGTSGPLAAGGPVRKDDTIMTGDGSHATIVFNDGTSLNFSPGSTLTLDDYVYDPAKNAGSSFFTVLQGAFSYVSGLVGHTEPPSQIIETVYGEIGIRGTEFVLRHGAASDEVDLISGILEISPNRTITTTTYTGPITIVFDGSTTTTSPLTQEQYESIKATLFPPAASDFTSPQVTVTFAAPPGGQAGYYNLAQTPVAGSVSASDASNIIAIVCSDSLGELSEGFPTGLNSGTASATLSLTGDGSHVVSCTASDGANNSGAATGSANSATVRVDATAPAVTYSGNLVAYTVDQTVAITCTASDALSGIASTTCQNISGPAYAFTLGANTFSATAKDKAGNSGGASTTFSVSVTYAGLVSLVNAWETKATIAANMVATLKGAQSAAAKGNASSTDNQLNSFINQVQAQSGKSLTVEQAAVLIKLAAALKI